MSDNSCSKFGRYRSRVGGFTHEVSAKEWPRLRAWFLNQGREEFCAAFRQETLIKPNATTDRGARLGAALPNSVADYEKKIADKAYYRAQAEFFLLEMDEVLGRVPADAGAKAAWAVENVLRFVTPLLLDSLVLFEHWRSCRPPAAGPISSAP